MIHSSVNYHQEDAFHAATEPRRLYKNVAAASGAVMVRFKGVSHPKDTNLWSARGIARVVVFCSDSVDVDVVSGRLRAGGLVFEHE